MSRAAGSAVTLAAAALAALAGAGARAAEARREPAPAWRLAETRTFEHRVTFAGFLDARRGLTVGGAGAGNMAYVFHTEDGGATWTEAASPAWRRHALELQAGGFAWHAGVLQIGRSFDGGATWYRGGNFGDGDVVLHLSFADENRGLAATARRAGRTDDGGLRWAPLPLPDGLGLEDEVAAISLALAPPRPGDRAPSLVALHTTRPAVARVLSADGRLFVLEESAATPDPRPSTGPGRADGRPWRAVPSPLAGRRLYVAGGAATAALRFTPEGVGVVAAFAAESGGWRLRLFRRRAGAEWAEEAAPDVPALGTLFLSPDGRTLTWRSLARDELRVYVRTD